MPAAITTTILESGESLPRVDTVEKLARAMKVSPCFLAFGIDVPEVPGEERLSAGLAARLIATRQARGLSRLRLGQLSGTSDTFVRMTETGATMPILAKLEALAKALGVSPAWLAYGQGPMEMSARRRVGREDRAPSSGQ